MTYILKSKGGHVIAVCRDRAEMQLHYEAYESRSSTLHVKASMGGRASVRNTINARGKRLVCRIYDNGGETLDRYTVCLKAFKVNGQGKVYPYLACSAYPFQSFGQHGESSHAIDGPHLGKRIAFDACPQDVQRFILQNI